MESKNKGFTLIELLVVVGIIAVLAAIAIPNFASYRRKGYDGAAASDAKNAFTASQAYIADYPGCKELSLEKVKMGGYRQTESVVVTFLDDGVDTMQLEVKHTNGTKAYTLDASGVVTPAR